MTETIGIPVAFILLTILILWVIIGIKGKWWIKSCLISLTLYFSIGLWVVRFRRQALVTVGLAAYYHPPRRINLYHRQMSPARRVYGSAGGSELAFVKAARGGEVYVAGCG